MPEVTDSRFKKKYPSQHRLWTCLQKQSIRYYHFESTRQLPFFFIPPKKKNESKIKPLKKLITSRHRHIGLILILVKMSLTWLRCLDLEAVSACLNILKWIPICCAPLHSQSELIMINELKKNKLMDGALTLETVTDFKYGFTHRAGTVDDRC